MSQAQSAELLSKIALWRQKTSEGTMTREDYIVAIKELREGRISASYASDGAKRKKAQAVIPDADDLLGELGGI